MASMPKPTKAPSASDWSSPKGPLTLGPMRCCIRATTRRSHQMLKRVSRTRIRKMNRVLSPITHHGSCPNSDKSSTIGTRPGTITGPLPS